MMHQALSTFAQLSVGLAGFAGIAAVIVRGLGRWSGFDNFRILALLYSAVGALFASLGGIAVSFSIDSDLTLSRWGAGFVFLATGLLFARLGQAFVQLDSTSRDQLHPIVAAVILVVMGLSALVQLAAVFGLTGGMAPTVYLVGLTLLLGYAAFSFVRLIFIRSAAAE